MLEIKDTVHPVASGDHNVFDGKEMRAVPVNGNFGMSIRQLYAGMAMQGILSADVKMEIPAERVAGWAVKQADALIHELSITAKDPK